MGDQHQDSTTDECLPLSQFDSDLAKMLDINMDEIEKEAEKIVDNIIEDTTKSIIDKVALDNRKTKLDKKDNDTLKVLERLQKIGKPVNRDEARNCTVRYLYFI